MNKTSQISEEMLVSPVMLLDSPAVFYTDLDSVQSRYPSVLFSPGTVTLGDSTFRNFSDNISYTFSNAPADYTVRSIDQDEDMIVLTDPWCRYRDEIANKERQKLEMYHAYLSRIEMLRSYAALDGFSVNKASEQDFWSFIESVPFVRKAEVVLVDNGNLRAIWDGEDSSHLGLQFLGNCILQYVIFRRRKRSRHISRVAGRDTFEGVKQQVKTFELEVLLQE
jgi:hypothetical protein